MKQLVMLLVVLAVISFMVGAAEASNFSCDGPLGGIMNKCIEQEEGVRTVLGAKLDAPNLVRFTDNLTLGLEGGKDMYTNPFRGNRAWMEDDKGYFGYVKITWGGSLIDFSKK